MGRPQDALGAGHGWVAGALTSRVGCPLEDRDRTPSALVVGGQQVPPGTEMAQLFAKHKLKAKHQALIRRVQGDFIDFLAESQLYLDRNLQRTFANNP